MIKVIDIAEQKKNFKRIFNSDCMSSFFVCINFETSKIICSTIDNYNTVRRLEMPFEQVGYEVRNIRKLNLSSIRKNHVLWDFIWNKDGFYFETYKNAYRDLFTTSKHGTHHTMAEVVFKTKRKEFEYFGWECDTIKVIDLL